MSRSNEEVEIAEQVAELMRVAALLLAQSERYSRKARAILARKPIPDDSNDPIGRPQHRPRKVLADA